MVTFQIIKWKFILESKRGIVFPCSSGGNPRKVKWISAVVKLFDFKYRLCFAVMWNQWLKCIKHMHYIVCTVNVWGNAAMVACVIGEENRIRQSVFFFLSLILFLLWPCEAIPHPSAESVNGKTLVKGVNGRLNDWLNEKGYLFIMQNKQSTVNLSTSMLCGICSS